MSTGSTSRAMGGLAALSSCLLIWALMVAATPAAAGSSNVTASVLLAPDTIGPGSHTRATVTLTNNAATPAEDLAVSSTLPTGVTIAVAQTAQSDCEGVMSVPPGGTTFSLSDGLLGGSQSCQITLDLTSSTAGDYDIDTNTPTSSLGSGTPGSDELIVDNGRPGFSKSFSPSVVTQGRDTTLTFTIDNTANNADANQVAFRDELPAGLQVADIPNLTFAGCEFPLGVPAGPAPGATVVELVAGDLVTAPAPNGGNFAGGASSPVPCTMSVDVTAAAPTRETNRTGNLGSGFSTTFAESGFALADLTVTPQAFRASFLNNPVPPGGIAQVRYTIDNVGASFTGGSFTSDLSGLPAGTTIATPLPTTPCGPSSSLADNAGTLALSGAELLSGASCSFDVSFQLAANAPVGTYTHTTGQLTVTPSDDESEDGRGPSDVQQEAQTRGITTSFSGPSETLVVDYRPVLTKTFPDGDVGEGGNTTLRFTITNDDPADAMTDITFIDNLTAFTGANLVTVVSGLGTDLCGTGSNLALVGLPLSEEGLELTGGSLDFGTSCTFDVVVTMPPGINGERVNQITDFTATHRSATVFGIADDATLDVLPAPIVVATIIGDPVIAGGAPILQLDLEHGDPDPNAPPATNIALSVDLDGALTGLVATGTPINSACGVGGGTVTGTAVIGLSGVALATGQTCQVQIPLAVPTNATPGAYPVETSAITATVAGLPVTGTEAGDDLDILGVSLAVEWKDEPALPGSTATITYRLQNHTPSTTYNNILFSHSLSSVVPGATVTDTTTRNDLCGSGSSLMFSGSFAFFSSGSLAGTQSCEFDIAINIPANTVSNNYAHPTSTVSYGGGGPAPAANDVLTVDNTAVQLKKEFIDDPVKAGEQVTLRYTLTNLSPSQSLEDLEFTDDLNTALPGLAATSLPAADVCGTGSSVSGAQTVSFAGGSLPVGGTCALDITLFVPGNANTSTAAATSTSDVAGKAQPAGVDIVGSGASDVLQVAGEVILAHAFDGPTVAGGSPTVTYTITNTGATVPVEDMRFSHNLGNVLAGLTVTGALPAGPCGTGSSASGTSVITLTGATLAPGATCFFSATLGVPAGTAAGVRASTTSGLQSGGIQVAAPSMANLPIEPPPTFTKVFNPDTIGTGDESRLTYTINNTASALAASSLAFTDALPAGVVVASPVDDANACGGTLSAAPGGTSISLAGGTVGASSTCTLALNVSGASAGTFISATGDLTSSSGNSGPAVDTITVSGGTGGTPLPPDGGADFALSITPQNAAIRIGDTATFTLTVTNLGPQVSGARVSYALSGGTIQGADGSCTISSCTIAPLSPSQSTSVTLSTSHPEEATGALNAVVTSNQGDPNSANNSATANFTVSEDPGLNPAGIDGIIESAVSISQERFTPAENGFAGVSRRTAAFVTLARADVFADALAGSVLTGDAPLLFTEGDALAPETGQEIQRVLSDGGTVYLLGGEAALSAAVEDALTDAGFAPQRLAGPSRIETALAVADQAQALYGQREVGVARAYGTGSNPTAAWADSVTGGGWAAATGSPIVLTPTSAPVHPAVESWMAANANPANTVVLGGPAAISEAVRTALGTDRRVAGEERAGTAVQIARELRSVAPPGARSYLLVNGIAVDGWAYGLMAAGLSSDLSAPVLLTNSTSAPAATVDEVTSCQDNPITLRRLSPSTELTDSLLADLDALDSAQCQEPSDPQAEGRGDQDTP